MSNFVNIGKRITELSSCQSTNDHALALLKEGEAHHGDVIYTPNQTSGRGQKGNVWLSPKGQNLTFSVVLEPFFLKPEYQFELTVFISVALITYLKSKNIEAKIKWPNDIYVKGKKLGGILIENKIKGSKIISSVVGIGININQKNFGELNATSLQQITGNAHTVYEELFNTFHHLNETYQRLQRGEDLRSDYSKLLIGMNEELLFDDGEQFSSKVVQVDDFGALVLNKNGVLKKYGLKEVKFLNL